MKKILIFSGVALAGYGVYRYFKYQVDMAMKYDYKIKNVKYLGTVGNDVKVSATIEITNKSNFDLTINSFDLELFYNGKKFANVVSDKKIIVNPNDSFDVTGVGVINVNDLKQSLPNFIADVLKQKPINIEVSGNVKVTFMKLNHTIRFDKEQFNYSTDLITEYGFGDKYAKLKEKYSKIFGALGLK